MAITISSVERTKDTHDTLPPVTIRYQLSSVEQYIMDSQSYIHTLSYSSNHITYSLSPQWKIYTATKGSHSSPFRKQFKGHITADTHSPPHIHTRTRVQPSIYRHNSDMLIILLHKHTHISACVHAYTCGIAANVRKTLTS